jgi:hypothetical protein
MMLWRNVFTDQKGDSFVGSSKIVRSEGYSISRRHELSMKRFSLSDRHELSMKRFSFSDHQGIRSEYSSSTSDRPFTEVIIVVRKIFH